MCVYEYGYVYMYAVSIWCSLGRCIVSTRVRFSFFDFLGRNSVNDFTLAFYLRGLQKNKVSYKSNIMSEKEDRRMYHLWIHVSHFNMGRDKTYNQMNL